MGNLTGQNGKKGEPEKQTHELSASPQPSFPVKLTNHPTIQLLLRESGQSLVELALVLPFLLMILLGIVQFGFIFSGQIAVSSAAREGARLAATGAGDTAVQERVVDMLAASPLLNTPQVVIEPQGGRVFGEAVKVRVRAGSPLIVPLPVGPSDGIFNLSAEAAMRVEHVGGGS